MVYDNLNLPQSVSRSSLQFSTLSGVALEMNQARVAILQKAPYLQKLEKAAKTISTFALLRCLQ